MAYRLPTVKKSFHTPNPRMSIADRTRRRHIGGMPKIKINRGLAPKMPKVKIG